MTKKILVVEDNKNNMRLIKQLIEDISDDMNVDIEIFCAESGQAALQLVKNLPLTLVLMDMSLPDMNGQETTNKLKEYPHLRETPFIVVTAYAMAQEEQLFRLTFDDYISKPIDEEDFISKIEQWIRGK